MASFDLRLHTRSSLCVEGEPSDFITHHHGEVVCSDDDTGAETLAGRVKAYRLHAGLALEHGEPLFDVCDSHSHEMHVFHTLLYEPHGYNFREPLATRFEAFDTDLLVLDYVVLDPRWRGLKLGLLVARKLIDLLGSGCGLVVSEVATLRRVAYKSLDVPAGWIPRQNTKAERSRGIVSLRAY